MNRLLLIFFAFLCFKTAFSFIVPKLLLPYYDEIQVNYTINAEEGCYKWRSQNPEIASIQPIPKNSEGCTKSAIVYVESRYPVRRITLILAENELTGTTLQCDVIIDRIHSVDIISRTRELYLDDPPETLNLRALDDEGNTFSSTAYMLFEWTLLPDLEGDNEEDGVTIPAHMILKVGKFIETDYNADPYVELMEKKGLQSDTILLSGLQTGTAYVMAKLSSAKDVMTAKIAIIVRDKVFLIPNGHVWLPQYGLIRYLVEQWRNGKPTEIKMPHQQYFLQLSDNTRDEGPVVSLDQETSVVTGLRLGDSQLFLMDRNLKQDTIQDSSDLHVVEPAYLKFYIQPDNRWVLETGRFYVIHVHLYDADNHRLWPSSNFRVSCNMDPYYFRLLESTKNGTWHSVEALKRGETELYAKLNGIILQGGDMEIYDPVIEAVQVAEIFDPITVYPPILVFPWQPKPVVYRHKLLADGGSGNYTWSINNDKFAIVSTNGVVTTRAGAEQEKIHEPASAIVRATDVRNPAHWGSSDVMLLPVVEILFARSHREAEIEDDLDLYLIMHAQVGRNLIPVVDCRESGVQWRIHDSSIFEEVEDRKVPVPHIPGTIACVGRRFRAMREGYTIVTATYIQTETDSTSTKLEASVTIAAFPALKAIDPEELAVVSLDSNKILRFRGGPIRWPLWHAGYERTASSGNSSSVEISPVRVAQQEHNIVSHCRHLGYSDVSLTVRNKPCNTNPIPVQSSVSVRVSCTVPHLLELNVPSLLPSCPLHNTDIIQTVALMHKPLPVNLSSYDERGNMFDNFSSIFAEWLAEKNGTLFSEDRSFFTPVDSTEQRKHIVNKVVTLAQVEGEQTISVSLTKYKDEVNPEICGEYTCSKLDPVVSGSVGVLVVSEPFVSPPSFSLYNHENSSGEVSVFGGSAHFSYNIKQDGNVTQILESKSTLLKLGAIRAGLAQLQVTDLCLDSVPVVTSDVVIAEVGKLQLKAPPRMELGSWVDITVEVADNFGNNLPSRFLPFIDLKIAASVADIVAVNKLHAAPGENLVVASDMRGANIGTTMLSAVSRLRDGRVIRSNAVRVVIFPALELHPPVVTLIRHAVYQLRTVGGPKQDFTMKFVVEGDNEKAVVNVSQAGLVHGLHLGTTTVSARAVMHDGTVFRCRAPSHIRVVQLAGIRIDAPLNQFHVGGSVPLHVSGLDDNANPMSFGSAIPGLVFEWEVANPSVAKLKTVHAKAGIETSPSLSFTMLAEGISSGHCAVKVRVYAEDSSLKQLREESFTAETSIMIYDPLAVVNTESCIEKQWKSTSKFLITPSTSHQLQTNRDGVAQTMAFDVLKTRECNPDTSDKSSDDCISVDENGVITSSPNQCQATLLITSVERFGLNQTLALHVLVRPVSYVIARAETHFRTRENIPVANAFPLSTTIKFVVVQFDDSGDKFDATSHNVILNMNRYDKVEVEPDSGNRSFFLRLPLEGVTIMAVESYLESTTTPAAVYYFPVNVKPAVLPQEQVLTIGKRFCFTSEFINLNGTGGSWTSPHSKGILVDPKTGAVLATSRTYAEVQFTVDNFKGVAQLSSAPFIATFEHNNLPKYIFSRSATYVLPMILSPAYEGHDSTKCAGLDKEMEEIAKLLFACSIKFRYSNVENIFDIEPRYISKSGTFACVITRQEISSEDEENLAIIDDEILVTLDSLDLNLGTIYGGVALVDFLPSFSAKLSSKTLFYGSSVKLCIKAIPAVFESIQVTSCDPKVLEINEDSEGTEGNYCYLLSTTNQDVTLRSAYVRIASRLTGQDEKIDITVDRVAGRLISSPSSCSPPDHTSWRGATDILTDTYLAYLSTASFVIVSVAILILAFTAFRWVTSNTIQPPSTSFLSQTPPPYDASFSSPSRGQGSPSSTPKVRLWSRYYQPQQASPNTG